MKRIGNSVCIGLLLLCLGAAWAGEEQSAGMTAPGFALSMRDNLLSAKIEGAPLWQVLAELSRAGVKVSFEDLSSEEKVSATFEDLPLEEGIKRLLQGKNHTLAYDQTASSAAQRVAEIRILPSRQSLENDLDKLVAAAPAGRSDTPCAPADGRSVEELVSEVLHSPDVAKRTAALKALGEKDKQDPKVVETMVAAFEDKAIEVRSAALEIVLLKNISVPEEALEQMAFRDQSPQLRLGALDGLVDKSESGAAKSYLERALQDPDPEVKDLAAQMLERIDDEEEGREAGG